MSLLVCECVGLYFQKRSCCLIKPLFTALTNPLLHASCHKVCFYYLITILSLLLWVGSYVHSSETPHV